MRICFNAKFKSCHKAPVRMPGQAGEEEELFSGKSHSRCHMSDVRQLGTSLSRRGRALFGQALDVPLVLESQCPSWTGCSSRCDTGGPVPFERSQGHMGCKLTPAPPCLILMIQSLWLQQGPLDCPPGQIVGFTYRYTAT